MMEWYKFLMKLDVFSPIEDTPWYKKNRILRISLYGKAIGSITKFMLREYIHEDDIKWHGIRTFPPKIITVYDYDNYSTTEVKVNASFVDSQDETDYFYLPYISST